ncbi:hypothetical protein Glove_428g63 [Diversispora epigaea]|uniref:Uncharacterized protein n=1 Tax=Diversispora epigaea TaxID=1348612 RepID=A0A397GVG5_9GLOM|nr:hypothetical protein Glove_428g63 [Diversispora epigaea]
MAQNEMITVMASLLYGNQTITIHRHSRKIRSIDIINKIITSSCNSNYSPIQIRAIATRAWSDLKNYPVRFRRRYFRMSDIANNYFDRNPGASSVQLLNSNSYRTTQLRISTSDALRLQHELVELPTPRSLEEAEEMLNNRILPTESTSIIHENSTPVDLFASMLTEGSASAFY